MPSLLLVVPLLALAADKPRPIEVKIPDRPASVSYAGEIADLLDAKCAGCHGATLAEGKLKVESVAGMLKGGKHGPSVVAGKADESLLFRMAAHRVEPVMPPADKTDFPPLTPDELGRLKLWIDSGARDDSGAPAPKPAEVGTLPPGVHPINAVDLTPDGRRVASGRGDVVEVFEVGTGRRIASLGGHRDLIQSVRFTPDAKRLAAGSFRHVTLWDVPADTGPWPEPRTFGPHADRVLAIDFSPDGKLMATGGGEPSRSGEVKLWDVATGKLVRSLDNLHSDTIFTLRFSPDGKRLATAAADKFVRVVGLADGKEIKSFEGHTHHVMGVDWSGDGKRIVSGGADGAVKVWDVQSGEQVRSLNPVAKGVTALRWVPGKALVVGSSGDGTVRAWNPENGTTPRTYAGAADYVSAVAASADGGRVAAGAADGVLLLWDGGGKLLRKIPQ